MCISILSRNIWRSLASDFLGRDAQLQRRYWGQMEAQAPMPRRPGPSNESCESNEPPQKWPTKVTSCRHLLESIRSNAGRMKSVGELITVVRRMRKGCSLRIYYTVALGQHNPNQPLACKRFMSCAVSIQLALTVNSELPTSCQHRKQWWSILMQLASGLCDIMASADEIGLSLISSIRNRWGPSNLGPFSVLQIWSCTIVVKSMYINVLKTAGAFGWSNKFTVKMLKAEFHRLKQ